MKFLKPTIYAVIFLSSLVTFDHAQAATRTWRGTTSTAWNTAGNWAENAVPTSADDVVFDNSAGTYTVNIVTTNAVAKSFVTTGTTNAVTVTSGYSISATVYGNVTLKSSDSVILTSLSLLAAGTFTQGGATLNSNIYIYYTTLLGSDVNIGTNNIIFYPNLGGQVFNTSPNGGTTSYNIICGIFSDGDNGYPKTLTLNNSTLNVSNVSFTGTAPTVTSTTHTINITATAGTITNFAGKAWGSVTINYNPSGGSTFAVTPGSGGSFVKLDINYGADRRDSNITFLNSFSLGSSSTWRGGGIGYDDPTMRPLIRNTNIGSNITVTMSAAGQTLTLTDVDLEDIQIATTNTPTVTTTRVGDAGGNSHTGTIGITDVSAPKTVYLDAGTTNDVYFSDNYWSTSSGGGSPSLNNYPLPQDTAIIDNNSFDDLYNTIWATAPRTGAIDASTLTESQGFYSNTIHYGSLILSTAITIGGAWTYNFDARVAGTLSISYTTRDLYNNITINSYGGVVQLSSSMLMATTILTLTRGTFDLNGNTLTTAKFSSTGTTARTLQATGGGNIYITGTTGTVWDMTDPTSLTVSNAPAVTLNGALTGNATFAGGGKTFGNFWNHTTGAYAVQFTGSNTFNNFKIDAGRTVQFTAGTTTTVNSLTATGTAAAPITISSITSASHTLTKAGGGTVTCEHCSISYSTASPANTWYATLSTNGGNNSGWTFPPTQIYRSVGPGKTTSLATGGSNAMSIAGSTATFASGLPTNVGVGDVIQYDSDNNTSIDALAFISGRTDSTHYTVKTSSGDTPTATSASDTDWSIFRAYISLANAESGIENTGINSGLRNFDDWTAGGDATTDDVGKDISTANQVWNIACYADAADTTAVAVDGWTTTATDYIRIYTPTATTEVGTSQRHSGKWDDGKYRLEITSTTGNEYFGIYEEFVRVDGLQMKLSVNGAVSHKLININVNNAISSIRLSNNIMRTGTLAGSPTGVQALSGLGARSHNIYLWNNIIYDFTTGSAGYAVYLSADGGYTKNLYAYNNTIINSYIGLYSGGGGTATITAKNNIVKGSGNSNAYVGTFASGTDYNATDGTDVTGQGSNSRVSQTFSFVDSANGDFHLSGNDTGAQNHGVDLSADANLAFSTDIDGDTHSGLWDIGADENTSVVINIQRNVNFGRNVNIK